MRGNLSNSKAFHEAKMGSEADKNPEGQETRPENIYEDGKTLVYVGEGGEGQPKVGEEWEIKGMQGRFMKLERKDPETGETKVVVVPFHKKGDWKAKA